MSGPLALQSQLAVGDRVWIPHREAAYTVGTLTQCPADSTTWWAAYEGQSEPHKVSSHDCFPLNPNSQEAVPDNTQLQWLYEPHVLENLRARYAKDLVYTYTAYILIAVNPYKDLPIYTPEIMASYRGKSIGLMPPSVFAVADRAFRDMRTTLKSQSILVSGESGAGKTETAKLVMRYLAAVGGDLALGGQIERRIVEANPLLEAFGNAKTTRNHNSSRFGKFTEIHFNSDARVIGARITTYILEKSRIVHQSAAERDYHIFYQLAEGAPAARKAELALPGAASLAYLKGSDLVPIAKFPDGEGYAKTVSSMQCIGMTDAEITDVFKVVAGVLHLGNIVIEGKKRGDGSSIAPDDAGLTAAAGVLAVPAAALAERITTRLMKMRGKAEAIRIPLSAEEAGHARDALAKAVYARLFDWIVERINTSLPFTESAAYIGVLDIAGFEFFELNSFEQFCINYANEKLQQHFNREILLQEQEIYQREGLRYTRIEFRDNQDVIDVIERAGTGVFGILDEESRLPQPTDLRFTERVNSAYSAHDRVLDPRKFKQDGRRYSETEAFVIRHFAGDVCYTSAGFLDKNHDALHPDLQDVVAQSATPFVSHQLFGAEAAAAAHDDSSKKATVGAKFRTQMLALMARLESTTSNFIRCIKPNQAQRPGLFDGPNIVHQLRCSGMLEALLLMQTGYPTRCSFAELYDRYAALMPPIIAALKPAQFCEALLFALDLSRDDFQLGLTRVFFRAGKMAFLDKITTSDAGIAEEVVRKVQLWLLRKKMTRLAFASLALNRCAQRVYLHRARERLSAGALAVHAAVRPLLAKAVEVRAYVAARRIQSSFRGMQDRRAFTRTRRAAIVIQANVRALLVYKAYFSRRKALKGDRLRRLQETAAARAEAAAADAKAKEAAARAIAKEEARIRRDARASSLAAQFLAEQRQRELEESRFKAMLDEMRADAAAAALAAAAERDAALAQAKTEAAADAKRADDKAAAAAAAAESLHQQAMAEAAEDAAEELEEARKTAADQLEFARAEAERAMAAQRRETAAAVAAAERASADAAESDRNLRARIAALEAALAESTAKGDDARRVGDAAARRAAGLDAELGRARASLDENEAEISSLKRARDTERARATEAEDALAEAEARAKRQAAKLAGAVASAEVDRLREQLDEAERSAAAAERAGKRLKEDLARAEAKAAEAVAAAEAESAAAKRALAAAESAEEDARTAASRATARLKSKEDALAAALDELEAERASGARKGVRGGVAPEVVAELEEKAAAADAAANENRRLRAELAGARDVCARETARADAAEAARRGLTQDKEGLEMDVEAAAGRMRKMEKRLRDRIEELEAEVEAAKAEGKKAAKRAADRERAAVRAPLVTALPMTLVAPPPPPGLMEGSGGEGGSGGGGGVASTAAAAPIVLDVSLPAPRPRSDSRVNRPRTDSVSSRPRTDSVSSRQRADSRPVRPLSVVGLDLNLTAPPPPVVDL